VGKRLRNAYKNLLVRIENNVQNGITTDLKESGFMLWTDSKLSAVRNLRGSEEVGDLLPV
jgi:hypothetical protein